MHPANTTVIIVRATRNKPFEVVRRNGRFRVRDSRTGRMMTGQLPKADAVQMANYHNRRTPGPCVAAAGGHSVRRSPSGRYWEVLDPDDIPIKELASPTRREALARVDAMLATRALTAIETTEEIHHV